MSAFTTYFHYKIHATSITLSAIWGLQLRTSYKLIPQAHLPRRQPPHDPLLGPRLLPPGQAEPARLVPRFPALAGDQQGRRVEQRRGSRPRGNQVRIDGDRGGGGGIGRRGSDDDCEHAATCGPGRQINHFGHLGARFAFNRQNPRPRLRSRKFETEPEVYFILRSPKPHGSVWSSNRFNRGLV